MSVAVIRFCLQTNGELDPVVRTILYLTDYKRSVAYKLAEHFK